MISQALALRVISLGLHEYLYPKLFRALVLPSRDVLLEKAT